MSSALDQLALRAKQWAVAIDNTRETRGSVLAFGTLGLKREIRVVLKICKQPGDEWRAGDILRAFDGDGTVKVYELIKPLL